MNRNAIFRIGAAALVLLFVACKPAAQKPVAKPSAGQLLFEEKCRTVAGKKIYRKVEGVDGLLLMKIRPTPTGRELADPMWPGAAFALEAFEKEYIETFLGYEYAIRDGKTGNPYEITPDRRGLIAAVKRSDGLPGYRFVDVVDPADGIRYRYTGRWEEPWQYDKHWSKGYIKFFLDKNPAPAHAPRYAVTYEDHVVPEERALWVASGTIKVLDMQTNEVLAETTRYAWAGGGPTGSSPSPWLRARQCGSRSIGVSDSTRKFVDQVLIPRKEQ